MSATVALGVALAIAATGTARADDAALDHGAVIFPRDGALYRADAHGKHEAQLATLPAGAVVQALATDAGGKRLVVELVDPGAPGAPAAAGSPTTAAVHALWMPLDGSATALRPLPCRAGAPVRLAPDGSCVVCGAASGGAQLVNLATGKAWPLKAPAGWVVGAGAGRRLVWAATDGVWSAPPGHLDQKTRLAPEPPLRDFLPSPDGTRAVGVYTDFVHVGRKGKQPAEVLMDFQLDGTAARRKGIRAGVPVAWSHDSQWVLVHDHGAACLMRALGGQYKCWKRYQPVSLAPDGSWALVLGPRDRKHDDGARALYRAKLAGPYDTTPVRVIEVVDGPGVWVP